MMASWQSQSLKQSINKITVNINVASINIMSTNPPLINNY